MERNQHLLQSRSYNSERHYTISISISNLPAGTFSHSSNCWETGLMTMMKLKSKCAAIMASTHFVTIDEELRFCKMFELTRSPKAK